MEKINRRNKVFSWTAVAAYFLLSFAKCGNSLDLERAKEQSCFKVEKTVPLDVNWMMSVKTWYYPLMHRYDLYNMAIQLTGKNPKDIPEAEVYYDSCITYEIDGEDFIGHGFNGKTLRFVTNTTSPNFETYHTMSKEGYGGDCYNTLTDNKTFFFNTCCVTGDQMIWGLVSTVPDLPKATVKQIHDHAESLGFKREFFTRLWCDFRKLEQRENKDTL